MVQHRRPDAPTGLAPRRVRRPARRHLPMEGRERGDDRRRGRRVGRPGGRGGHRLRREGARRGRARRDGGRGVEGRHRSSTARRWPRPSTSACPATRCRCSYGSSIRWSTRRRSRARRSICASKDTDPTSRIRLRAERSRGRLRPVLRRLPDEVTTAKAPVVNRTDQAWKRGVDFSGRPVAGDRALIMAIVNRTPDSFYDRGATFTDEAAKSATRPPECVCRGIHADLP